MTEQELANVIWDIKEVIRNSYDDSEVEDVILPFTLLRRLDCVLEDKYEAILDELNKCEENLKKYKLVIDEEEWHHVLQYVGFVVEEALERSRPYR